MFSRRFIFCGAARTSAQRRRRRDRFGVRRHRATVRQSAIETVSSFGRLARPIGIFLALLVFFLLIGFLKAIFLQMDYVFPKFGDRELGLRARSGNSPTSTPSSSFFWCRWSAHSLKALPPIAWSLSAAPFARQAFSSWRCRRPGLWPRRTARSANGSDTAISGCKEHSSLLYHGGALSDRVLDRRSVLFAARL